MTRLPEAKRREILTIANRIRRQTIKEGKTRFESGRFVAVCAIRPSTGGCADAAHLISMDLHRAHIDHNIMVGCWTGPVDAFAREFMSKGDEECPRGTAGHVWVEFPQYDNAILDVTADQFDGSLPGVLFPANSKWYRPDPHYRQYRARRLNSIRNGPVHRAKVHVREHLKHPPRSCLCHHSKTVNRARRGMVRRLK